MNFFRISVPAERRRVPLLEQLLARSDPLAAPDNWRAQGYAAIVSAPAVSAPSCAPSVAAVALRDECGAVDAAWVYLATPVNYIAEMSNVRLAADGALSLAPGAAGAIAADFNRVWHDAGVRLVVGRTGILFALFQQPVRASTVDPQDVLGRHIESYLPSGEAAALLRKLMSEVEMWMFEHPANGERSAQGAVPVSGLWLWGGGAVLASLPEVTGWTAGEDVFFKAFPTRCEYPGRLDTAGPSGAVVVIHSNPSSDTWPQIESRWLQPALTALRQGRIATLQLSLGQTCFSVSKAASRRFWRRTRPWWETLT